MSDQFNTREPAWGEDFAPFALPDPGDLTALHELAAAMPDQSPAERAWAAVEKGLLKDLSPNFARQAPANAPVAHRRVSDLATLIEAFESAAIILGYTAPEAGSTCAWGLELHLRDLRIDRCDLSSMEVHWPARIEHCRWPNSAIFVGTRFHSPASFLGGTFLCEANFFAATFESDAFFGGAHFYSQADFRGATFSGELDFIRANFMQSLELRFATFEKGAVLSIQELRFNGSTVLGGSMHLHLHQIRGGDWPNYRGRVAGENSTDRRELENACDQYGELEANFAAQGSPDASMARDWCHYRYMDLRRRSHLKPWNPIRWLDWLFMKWCFGYGIYTKRILGSAVAVIVLFGLAYFTNGFGLSPEHWSVENSSFSPSVKLSDEPRWHVRMGDSLYFSAVSFTTIGYGDWHPCNWAKAAGALEGFLGVFVMSLFTVSFSRKILR